MREMLKIEQGAQASSLSLWERWPPKGVGAGTEKLEPSYILGLHKGCSLYAIC